MRIVTKRVYEPAARSDGRRILVDRLWPRGLSRGRARFDYWARSVAPSHELRRWYGHSAAKWDEFRRRYFAELAANPDGMAELRVHLGRGTTTLLYSSTEQRRNNATALRQYLARQGRPGRHSARHPAGGSGRRRSAAAILLALTILPSRAPAQGAAAPTSPRAVAYTFDDLPATRFASLEDGRFITTRLLNHIRTLGLPAIGFVNERKLAHPPGEEAERAALLDAWLDAGLELGNHTYSHLRLYDTTLAAFQADVLRGDRVTRRLMAERGRRPRYFRHPMLNTGRDRDTKRRLERFLADHGYVVAPVTIDNDEYLYALAYDRARTRGDAAMMDRLGRDYVRYMALAFEHYEALSRALLGREPAQVLLLHANALNADWLDELAAMIAGRGYHPVTLDEALADPAYTVRDEYIGPRGPSWLERWARTLGREPGAQPQVPGWVRAAGR